MMRHKTTYRVFSVICALTLVLGLCPVSAIAQNAADSSVNTEEAISDTSSKTVSAQAADDATTSASASTESEQTSTTEPQEATPFDTSENVSSNTSEPGVSTDLTVAEPGKASSGSTSLRAATIATEYSDGQLSTENDLGSVLVDYQSSAKLPDGCQVTLNEISKDDARYNEYIDHILSIETDATREQINARIFDIAIVSDGDKTEPSDEVDVELTLNDDEVLNQDTTLVHFPDDNKAPEVLEAQVVDDTISFTTTEFSAFCVYNVDSYSEIDNLDGKSFLIANWNHNKGWMGVVNKQSKDKGFALTQAWANAEELTYPPDAVEPQLFTFHAITEPDSASGVTQAMLDDPDNSCGLYKISVDVNGQTKWLNMTSSKLQLNNNPTPFRIIPGSGDYENEVMIKAAAGTSIENYRINLKSGNINNYVQPSIWADINQNDWFTLIDADKSDVTVLDTNHSANKISVSLLDDGDPVVIYRSVWNDQLNQYVQLAINGYGDLVQVTDDGGYVGWYDREDGDGNNAKAVTWRFTIGRNTDGTPSGYYWFQNTETGAFLSPKALFDYDGSMTGELVFSNYDAEGNEIIPGQSNSFNYSLQLPGREKGEFTSRIITWSKTGGTESLYYLYDEDETYSYEPKHGSYGDADKFNFAREEQYVELSTKRTLDSTALGVTIKMFDYSDKTWQCNVIGNSQITNISTTEKRQLFISGVVERTLSNGLPVSTITGQELSPLFTGGSDANHLFLESVYGETGYYEYNSTNNYAYYNQTGDNAGNFTIYNEIGSPEGNNVATRSHGHFMPYSQLLTTVWADATNTVDAFQDSLPISDPRRGEPVHKIETVQNNDGTYDYNYNFGMEIEANFNQTEHDKYGNDIIFEFSGDDDLWLFIDNVLVLDLGGIHSAISGSVNFTTGEINYHGYTAVGLDATAATARPLAHTIKEAFQMASVLPDGSVWDANTPQSEIDKFFDGDTFKENYFNHNMKMFYMERGKNASNLHVRFNLQSIPDNTFLVTKEVTNTNVQAYTDKKFYYQAFLEDGTPLTSAHKATRTYAGTWATTDDPVTFETVELGGTTYQNVFELGHLEGAYFDINDTDSYYVKEIEVYKGLVDKIYINGVEAEYNAGTDTPSLVDNPNDDTLVTCTSTTEHVSECRHVGFTNELKANNLRITKTFNALPGQHYDPDKTFQFRLKVGPDANNLQNYSVLPYYLVKNVNGTDVYYYRINGQMTELHQGQDGNYYYYDENNVETIIPTRDPSDPIFDYSSQTGYIDYVPAGYTVIVAQLPSDIIFEVTETGLPNGYTLDTLQDMNPSGSFIPISGAGENAIRGQIEEDEIDSEVEAINSYHEVVLRFRKTDFSASQTYLEDAQFSLYDAEPEYSQGGFHFYTSDKVAEFESDEDGYLRVINNDYYGGNIREADLYLPTGVFYLQETQAPDGYAVNSAPVAFRLNEDNTITILGTLVWDSTTSSYSYQNLGYIKNGPDTTINDVTLATAYLTNKNAITSLPLTGMSDSSKIIGIACALFTLGVLLRIIVDLRSTRKRLEQSKAK